MYPHNHKMGQKLQTDARGISADRSYLAHFQIQDTEATLASTTGVHAAVIDIAEEQVIITEITSPNVPRNITATAGGTATDIGEIQVIVEGTNYNGDVITETLPAFTVDTAGSVTGNKAFKTVTKITIPAHDGVLATTTIGFGEKLGIPYKLTHNTVLNTYLDNVKEATAPAVTVSATALESNTIDLNSVLNSKVVDVYLIV